MANYNMSYTKKRVAELGLTVQLIPSNNPNTCARILAGTQEFRVANKTNAEIEAILLALKEGCKNVADEFRANTNVGNIEKFINLNQSINRALQEYTSLVLSDSINTVGSWQDMLVNFYCYDDEGKEIDGLNKVEEIMNTLLDNKDIVIYNNYIFNKEGVHELVKKWANFNNIENINTYEVTNKYMNLLARV